ncbi:MAG: hypothetical protein OXO50_08185 [Caldilineaceae bacterium]|nr:hypothetical protein [Caldilineaceae bacterium]
MKEMREYYLNQSFQMVRRTPSGQFRWEEYVLDLEKFIREAIGDTRVVLATQLTTFSNEYVVKNMLMQVQDERPIGEVLVLFPRRSDSKEDEIDIEVYFRLLGKFEDKDFFQDIVRNSTERLHYRIEYWTQGQRLIDEYNDKMPSLRRKIRDPNGQFETTGLEIIELAGALASYISRDPRW